MLDRATKVEEIVRHSVGHTYIYIYIYVCVGVWQDMPQRLVMELPAWSTWVDVDMFWECDVCFWKCSRVRNRLKQPGPEPSQDYFMKAYQSFVKLLERTGWQRLEFDHPLGTRPTHGKLTDGSRCGRHRPSNWRQFFADMDPHLEDILGVVPSTLKPLHSIEKREKLADLWPRCGSFASWPSEDAYRGGRGPSRGCGSKPGYLGWPTDVTCTRDPALPKGPSP